MHVYVFVFSKINMELSLNFILVLLYINKLSVSIEL